MQTSNLSHGCISNERKAGLAARGVGFGEGHGCGLQMHI